MVSAQGNGGRPKELLPPGRILHLLRIGKSKTHRSVYGPRRVAALILQSGNHIPLS